MRRTQRNQQQAGGLCGRRFGLALGLACLLAVIGFGCIPKPGVAPEAGPAPAADGLWGQADSAWQSGSYQRAEELYLRLARSQAIDEQDRVRAWQGVAKSGLKTGHLDRVETALNKWATLEPEAEQTWDWQEQQAALLLQQDRTDAFREQLKQFCLGSSADWTARRQALERLTDHFLDSETPHTVWPVHQTFYQKTAETGRRVQLEQGLMKRLRSLGPEKWKTLRKDFAAETAWSYPYALVEWFSTVQQLRTEQMSWSHAWERLSSLLERSDLESKPNLHTIFVSLKEQYGQPALGVALLLPLSGVYKDIGWSICRGADVALWQLNRMGVDIHVRLINTMDSDWARQLERLPKNFMAVGGPLRHSVWKTIMANGLQEERVFFAFRPELNPGWEGIDGYRFFPSHADQLRPLVRMMTEELDLTSFGILYPDSSYGRRMAEAFWRQAVEHQGEVTALSSYSPRSHSGLQQVVADFLQVPEELRDGSQPEPQETNGTNATMTERPEPNFEAVFIPDSFSKARLLIPEFFYFDEPRLIFLGPALWSQEMEDVSKLDRQYFNLAAMSGAWWSGRSSSAAERLRRGLKETAQGQPDFWVGLGYDFLRFASSLGPIAPNWSPESVTRSLGSFSNFNWSIAPLSWNRHGEASQDLFVFRAKGRKGGLLDPQRLKEQRQEIKTRFEQFRKQQRKKRIEEQARKEGS